MQQVSKEDILSIFNTQGNRTIRIFDTKDSVRWLLKQCEAEMYFMEPSPNGGYRGLILVGTGHPLGGSAL